MTHSIPGLEKAFDELGYIVEEELATILFLMLSLKKPLLLEGHPGVGKTEIANILASYLDTDLIRLQCYEGLDSQSSLYEWNYQKQLLSIKIQETGNLSESEKERHIFSEEFLLQRPLLKAISNKSRSPILLIDEIDRADEEFEAFLLELLSAYQISIPEWGTIKAIHPPLVILTSNRTRELSDALRRRCLYHWIEYPSFEKELKIVKKRLPGIGEDLGLQVVKTIQSLRARNLEKAPGISETLDWVNSLHALGKTSLDEDAFSRTLGAVLKSHSDEGRIRQEGLAGILENLP